MDASKTIDPAKALDAFFQIVREEAGSNPKFGRRLVEAVGYKVVYRGDEATAAIDPVLVAMHGLEEFRSTFSSMTPEQIQKIGEQSGLLQKPATGGKKTKGAKVPKPTQSDLVALLWDRARQRMVDLFPQLRQAAE